MNQYANDFNRTVELYYDDLKKYKPLTKAKERMLLKLSKGGNVAAKNELIEANLKFVFDIAKHYTGRGLSISELISEGNIGLIKAIDKFDEHKDVRFISYAVWWIKQSIIESINKKRMLNFVDINNGEMNAIENIKSDFTEIEDNNYFDLSNEDVRKEDEIKEKQFEIVSEIISKLPDRERDIIETYYGLNDKDELTLLEIGKKYNLTSERVRQIKKKCLKKLRSEVLLMDDVECFC